MKRTLAVVFGLFALSTAAAPALAFGPRPEPTVSIMHRAQMGELVVRNQSGLAQQLVINDRSFGVLRPGAIRTLSLPAGRHVITWTSAGRFAMTESEVIRISPHEREVLRLTPATAALKVKNSYPFAVRLVVDGKRVGRIAPGATLSVSGLAPGRTEIELFRGNQKIEDETMRLGRGLNTFEPGRFAFNQYHR
jgi:hypothetical protein